MISTTCSWVIHELECYCKAPAMHSFSIIRPKWSSHRHHIASALSQAVTWLTVSTVDDVSCTRPLIGSRAVLMPCRRNKPKYLDMTADQCQG